MSKRVMVDVAGPDGSTPERSLDLGPPPVTIVIHTDGHVSFNGPEVAYQLPPAALFTVGVIDV